LSRIDWRHRIGERTKRLALLVPRRSGGAVYAPLFLQRKIQDRGRVGSH
jgi:hypothetical protein